MKLKIFLEDSVKPSLYPLSSIELGFGKNIMVSKIIFFNSGVFVDNQSHLI